MSAPATPTPVERLLGALPAVVLALLLGRVARLDYRTAVPVAVALLPALVRRRFALTSGWQLLLSAALLGAGIGLARSYAPPLTGVHGALALLAYPLAPSALLVMTARRFLASPTRGEGATLAIGLTGLLACGYDAGPYYAGFVAAYLALAALAHRAADPARPPLAALGARHLGALAVAVVAGSSAAVGLVLGLQPLYERAVALLLLDDGPATTGFNDGAMRLGSLAGMEVSDRVVLRAFGAHPDAGHGLLLRGAVLRTYRSDEWTTDLSDAPAVPWPAAPEPPLPEPSVRVELERADAPRLFFPLEVAQVRVDGRASADALGVLRRPPSGPTSLWFQPGPRAALPVAAPDARDLALPPRLVKPLAELLGRWTAGASSPAQQLDAIVARLEADYVYSRTFQRTRGRDATLDFLETTKAGHCEYFASALALLARAAGIPARVVTGYRLVERNPVGGYHVARERHAHAWVEAWLPERGWASVDPSPAVSVEPDDPPVTSLGAALWDLVGLVPRLAGDFVAARSPLERWGVPLALLGAVLLRRWLRLRRAQGGSRAAVADDAPAAYVVALLGALAQRGFPRDGSEPLERLAERLAASPEAAPPGAAELLHRCAALLYGGLGDPAALRGDIARFVARP